MKAISRAARTWQSARQFVGSGKCGKQGIAAIEFAIIVPILALLLLCTVDIGMGFYRKMEVQTAAQAGAEYAAVHGYSVSSISSAITNTASYSINASPSPAQFCGCASTSGVTTATCSSTCPDGTVAGTYVTASASATYNTILQYPMLPTTFTLQAQSTVRIQ